MWKTILLIRKVTISENYQSKTRTSDYNKTKEKHDTKCEFTNTGVPKQCLQLRFKYSFLFVFIKGTDVCDAHLNEQLFHEFHSTF